MPKFQIAAIASEVKQFIVIGENHDESNARRNEEKAFAKVLTGSDGYWMENNLPSGKINKYGNMIMIDKPELLIRDYCLEIMKRVPCTIESINYLKQEFDKTIFTFIREEYERYKSIVSYVFKILEASSFKGNLVDLPNDKKIFFSCYQSEYTDFFESLYTDFGTYLTFFSDCFKNKIKMEDYGQLVNEMLDVFTLLENCISNRKYYTKDDISFEIDQVYSDREKAMIEGANQAVQNGYTGVWKIGDRHIMNMLDPSNPNAGLPKNFKILTLAEFDTMLKTHKKTTALKRSNSTSKLETKSMLNRRNSI